MHFSLYLHIPFCAARCTYCDFNTYAGQEALIPDYLQALAEEIRLVGDRGRHLLGMAVPVHTLYFGGGTPTLLAARQFDPLLSAVHDAFHVTPRAEVTVEANPKTLHLEKLRALHAMGVTRLSIGAQSAHPAELRILGRRHDFRDVMRAVENARKAGFENINLDLIYGLPCQELEAWKASLRRALALRPEHLSLYALSIEPGTPLHARLRRGLITAPDPDLAADMYEWACAALEYNGYAQYEISNWARRSPDDSPLTPRLACLHNLQYWRNRPYLGLGAGAHGYARGWRYSNTPSPRSYIARLRSAQPAEFPFSPALESREAISADRAIAETMMMGLRLTLEGVGDPAFRQHFGVSLADRFRAQLAELQTQGLISWDGARARLTPRGRLLANRAFAAFL